MLSILIPVFNFDVRKLVSDLHEQCLGCKIEFEILCLDDGSKNGFKIINREILRLKNVIYEELTQNLGRSKIRNELAGRAKFEHLIFMDCDSMVVSGDYVFNYLNALRKLTNLQDLSILVYGGRCYSKNPPENPNHFFHWTYGINREQTSAAHRKKQPYHSFMTNNFLISKSIFEELQFDENLTQYGHEDTLFGLELKVRNIPIIHINNPLEHIGLEETEVFLSKTQKGIQNLHYLSQKNDLIETRLLNVYRKLKRFGLAKLTGWILKIFEPIFLSNLKSKHPNLKFFDLFKLGYLCRL